MLTDDDLTRDLRAAFHDAAGDLTYDGPVPTVRRTPAWAQAGWLALPAAAAVAATVVVGAGSADDATAPPSATPSSIDPTAPDPGSPAPELVTEEIHVAGFTFRHQRAATDPPIVLAMTSPDSVPDGAREIDFPPMDPARAWVGTDPETGVAVLYLKAPTRNDGKLTGLSGRGLDEADLIDLLKNGSRD